MSRAWAFDLDRYIIRKGWGTFDLDGLIANILQNPGLGVGSLMNTDSRIDLSQSELTGVEIDAMNMAIRRKKIDEESLDAIRNGPTDPNYQNAVKMAITQGSDFINAGITQQNEINRTRTYQGQGGQQFPLKDMPPAFFRDRNGQVIVNPAWKQGASAAVGQQLIGGRRVNPHVGPPGEEALVTHVYSSKTGRQSGHEGWARPYEEALQQMGLVSKKRNDRYIRGHMDPTHRRGISFNDDTQALKFISHVENVGESLLRSGVPMAQVVEQVAAEYLDKDEAFHTTGSHHHSPESTFGRDLLEGGIDAETTISDDEAQQMEMIAESKQTGVMASPEGWKSIVHPESRDASWYRQMHNNTRSYFYDADEDKVNQKVLDYLNDYLGMEEDEAKQWVREVHSRDHPRGGKGGIKTRFERALAESHASMPQGMPEHYTGDVQSSAPSIDPNESARIMPEVGQTTTTQQSDLPPIPVPPPPPPKEILSPPERKVSEIPPPVPERPQPPPRGLPAYPGGGLPPGIKTDIPLSDTPQRGTGGDSIKQQIADILMNLREGNTEFSKSDAQDVERYLEMVQLELAKATIEDKYDVPNFNIDSPTDIAMMGAHIQRPTTDVIGILFTKGDWRNIAKTMGVDHEQVQLVKVAFS